MSHDVLILLRWPAKAFRAVIAAMGIVFGVDGDHVSLEPGCIPCVVVAILALVYTPFPVTLRYTGAAQDFLTPMSSKSKWLLKTLFVREGLLLLGVHGQNMPTENERICDFKVAMPALVQLFSLVRRRVLLELRRPVKALSTDLAFMRIVFGVNGNNVTL